ncbi:hypothetical protein CBL_00308 [Carabus blaptoides fortunei]
MLACPVLCTSAGRDGGGLEIPQSVRIPLALIRSRQRNFILNSPTWRRHIYSYMCTPPEMNNAFTRGRPQMDRTLTHTHTSASIGWTVAELKTRPTEHMSLLRRARLWSIHPFPGPSFRMFK